MDPQSTWIALLAAVEAGNWQDAQDHASNLKRWLARGGFPPDTSGGQVTRREWNRRIAEFACRLAEEIAATEGFSGE